MTRMGCVYVSQLQVSNLTSLINTAFCLREVTVKTPAYPSLKMQRRTRGPRYPLYLLLYNEDK